MMSISDVSALDLFKFFLEKAVVTAINFPQAMWDWNISLILHLLNHAVRVLDLGQMLDLLLNWSVFFRTICEEDWSNICSLDVCQHCSVQFFLLQCLLMLLNQIVLVIGDWASRNKANLLAPLHDLRVDVESCLVVSLQPVFVYESMQVLLTSLINELGVGVSPFRQRDLGLVYVQEA